MSHCVVHTLGNLPPFVFLRMPLICRVFLVKTLLLRGVFCFDDFMMRHLETSRGGFKGVFNVPCYPGIWGGHPIWTSNPFLMGGLTSN